MKQESAIRLHLIRVLETVFLALTGFYLLYWETRTSCFNFTYTQGGQRILFLVFCAVVAARTLVLGFRHWSVWAAAGCAVLYALAYRATGYIFLTFLGVMTVGMIAVDVRRLLRVFLASVGVYLAVVLLGALSGSITNLIYVREGLRSAWGMNYPTDLASAVLLCCLFLWAAFDRLPDLAALPLALLSLALSVCIAKSMTATAVGVLFAAAVLYRIAERRFLETRCRPLKKTVHALLILAFPICAAVMFGLIAAYLKGVPFAEQMNGFLSDRLRLAADAYRAYGLTPFGTAFEQIGYGGTTFRPEGYNFVDSSYPLILLRYGWVTFLMLGALWCFGTARALRNGYARLGLVMALTAVLAFMEHHFTELYFNVLLIAPFGAMLPPERDGKLEPKRAAFYVPFAAAVCVGAYFLLPELLMRLRTFWTVSGVNGRANPWTASLLLALLVLAAGALVLGLCRALRGLIFREKFHASSLGLLLLGALVLIGGFALSERQIERQAPRYSAAIEAERGAIETVLENGGGPLYADDLPTVYRKAFPKIGKNVLGGEDLARLPCVSVLTPLGPERHIFFRCGFLYAALSDAHALYTNDPAAIAALTERGIRLTGYYAAEEQPDIEALAEANGLPFAEGGIVLEESARTLTVPIGGLYAGEYTVSFAIASCEGAGEAVSLWIAANDGEAMLAERTAPIDTLGPMPTTLSIPFCIDERAENYRSVEAMLEAPKGVTLTVSGVRYGRTPSLDVHTAYDRALRKTREAFFAPDGTPTPNADGAFAVGYGYDAAGNVAEYRYYGADGSPMTLPAGYAVLRRTYDEARRTVREAYFDEQDRPALLADGYASVAYAYDAEGRRVETRYFGTDGAPAETVWGMAAHAYSFAADGTVRESFFDTDGKPVLTVWGYAGEERNYDGAGRQIRERFFGTDGAPILRPIGFAEIRTEHGDGVVTEYYFDADGNPVVCALGCAARRYEYDGAGNVIRTVYLGLGGEELRAE